MTTTINNEHKKLNVPNKQEQNQTCLDSAEREGLRPKGNVPNLRFPEFQGEWEKRTIGEISTIKNGPFGSVLHADDYVDEGIPIVTTEHFKNGNLPLSKNGIPQVSEDDYYRLRGYKLEKDDIVFSRVGSIDINAHVEQPQQGWLFSGRVLRVRPIKSVNSLCLHYILSTESVKRSIRNRAVGQTMPSINTPILSNTKINIPQSVGEQKKIANLLALLDERIATQNKIIDKLQSLIKGIADKLFQTARTTKPLLEFAPNITSGTDKSGSGTIPLYGSTGIIGTVKNASQKGNIVLVARVGTIGTVQYVNEPCGVSDNALIVEAGEMTKYIYHFLKTYNFARITSGTTQPLITASSLKKAAIPTYDFESQTRIVLCLNGLEKKLDIAKQYLSEIAVMKQYLLRQMFV